MTTNSFEMLIPLYILTNNLWALQLLQVLINIWYYQSSLF